MSEEGDARPAVGALDLATTFGRIALSSFGGGLSGWARLVLVVDKKWLDDREFLSALTLCRILPGSNQVNLAVFVGAKMRGLLGAVAAVIGLCALPMVMVLALGFLYFHFKEVPTVQGFLRGASAAAVALTLTVVVQTGRKCLTGIVPGALCAASFALNGLLRWPLLTTLAIVAPLSLLWAWPRRTGS